MDRLNIDIVNKVADAYLETAEGSDAERLRFLKGLWEIQSEAEQADRPYEALDETAAREALQSGKPLFLVAPPVVPAGEYAGLVSRIATYAADFAGLPADQADALRSADFGAAITDERLATAVSAPQTFTSAVLADVVSAGQALMPATVRFVLLSALVPFLTGPAAAALAVIGEVDRSVWTTSTCPVCGSSAAMGRIGESTTLQGASRVLWCGLCHSEWAYERLRCVRCGTRNPRSLRYTHVEGDPAHRVHLCDECHGYAKFVAMNDLGKQVSMLVEEAVTARLDAIALENGYTATGDVGGQAH